MKKATKPIKVFKTPPPNWPTEEQLKDARKMLRKQLVTKALAKNASPVEFAKQNICAEFVIYFNKSKITQRELAKRLDVTESRVSEILHYHHARFTIDKLLELLVKIKPEVQLKVA